MVWFIAFCAVAVMGLAAVAGAGRFGEMPPAVVDESPAARPREVTPNTVRQAQFDVVLRGYSMEQVDELLNRVAQRMQVLEGSVEHAGDLTEITDSETLG